MVLLTEAEIFPAQTGLVESRLLYAIQVDRVFSCELCGLFVVVGWGFRGAWEEVVMWVGRTTVRTGNQSVSQSVNQTDSQIVSQVGPSGAEILLQTACFGLGIYALARRGEPVVATDDETTTKSLLLLLSSLWWHAIV